MLKDFLGVVELTDTCHSIPVQKLKIDVRNIILFITLVMRSLASAEILIPCLTESGHLIGPDSIF